MDSCDIALESATSYRTVLYGASKSLILLFITFHVFAASRTVTLKLEKYSIAVLLAFVGVHELSSYAELFAQLRCNSSGVIVLDSIRILTEFLALPGACALVYYILAVKYVESSLKLIRVTLWAFFSVSVVFLLLGLAYEIGTLITIDVFPLRFALCILLSTLAIITSVWAVAVTHKKILNQTVSSQNILIAAMIVLMSIASIIGSFSEFSPDVSTVFTALLVIFQAINILHGLEPGNLPFAAERGRNSWNEKAGEPDLSRSGSINKKTIPRNRVSIISPSPQPLEEAATQKKAPSTGNSLQRSNSVTFAEIDLNDNSDYRPKTESASRNAAKLAKRRSTLVLDENAITFSEYKLPSSRSPSPTDRNVHFGAEETSNVPATPSSRAKRMSTYLSYPPSSV